MTYVVYADGPSGPRLAPRDAVRLAGPDEQDGRADSGGDSRTDSRADGRIELLLGWTPTGHDWLDDPELTGVSVLAGAGVSGAVRDGRLAALPVRLGAVATMLQERAPDVAVVAGVRRGDGYAFCRSVGWADVLARVADRVVVEVDGRSRDLGGPDIEGNVVAAVPRDRSNDDPPVPRELDDVDRIIGEYVVDLLPADATVQFGLGGVADAIAAAIDRPVGLWSGLLTDTAARLHERGLLLRPVTASYTWGGEAIDRLHADGMLDLVSATVTHDVGRLAAIPRLVSCNGALQVGLDGAVNLERVNGRVISGIGGHADFSAGATKSVGGCSVVATRSTTSRGDSSIVPEVEVVSTQRSDVGVVVTEHGVADLRGVGDAERARRLISIAAPEHRPALRALIG